MLKNIEKLKQLKEIKTIDYLISTEDNEICIDPYINNNSNQSNKINSKLNN